MAENSDHCSEDATITKKQRVLSLRSKSYEIPKLKVSETTIVCGESSTQSTQQDKDQRVVQGTFHQGHHKFGNNSGKQCVANSLCAVLYSHMKMMNEWCPLDMDLVLNTGNQLYSYLSNSSTVMHEYLLINELPDEVDVFSQHFNMKYDESVCGTFGEELNLSEFNMVSLRDALEQTLQKYSACFICFHSSTFSVIAHGGMYYIFDSHSRNHNGLQSSEGRSLLKCVASWQGVHRYCTELGHSMNVSNTEQFEITGVTVLVSDHTSIHRHEHICSTNSACVNSTIQT